MPQKIDESYSTDCTGSALTKTFNDGYAEPRGAHMRTCFENARKPALVGSGKSLYVP